MIQLPPNDDYNRWGPYRDGTPPGADPIRFRPGAGEMDGFALVAYLVTAGFIGVKVYGALAATSAVLAWGISVALALVLLWVWPVIYAVGVTVACAVIVWQCAIMIIRAFSS